MGRSERGPAMARAETASASVRSDSIKGLAQSIAKPAYRRLLTAEPALRRAVPALIIAFLLTICVGAFVQVLDHRRQAIAELLDAARSGRRRHGRPHRPRARRPRRLRQRDSHERARPPQPAWLRASGRQLLVTNADGVIVAGSQHVRSTSADGDRDPAPARAPASSASAARHPRRRRSR